MNDAGRGESGLLERKFGLARNGTDVRTEVVAGITTFLTMAYIVFVNPAILANAGMDKGAVFVATCLAAAISTLIMALYANYPIALAPGSTAFSDAPSWWNLRCRSRCALIGADLEVPRDDVDGLALAVGVMLE